jgi:hypothetical protein
MREAFAGTFLRNEELSGIGAKVSRMKGKMGSMYRHADALRLITSWLWMCRSKAERVKYAESLQNLRAMLSRDGNLYCLGGLGTVNMETTFEPSKSASNTRNRGMVDRALKIAQTKSEEL